MLLVQQVGKSKVHGIGIGQVGGDLRYRQVYLPIGMAGTNL
jgi:hypothetical protein